MLHFLILSSLLIISNVNGQFHGDSCVKKTDNKPGVCEFIEDCPSAKTDFRRGIRPQICSFMNRKSIVCCVKETATEAPRRTPSTKTTKQRIPIDGRRISVKKCEDYRKLVVKEFSVGSLLPSVSNSKKREVNQCKFLGTSLVVGGETTKTGEFPHMAAIGYEELNEIKFDCGGSLISEKFVLTAAHCVRRKKPPVLVRLGDQNLKSTNDGAQPQEFRVKNYIRHESYTAKTNYYDIGLIELDGEARFTKFVRPACLWQEMNIPSQTAIATGWGMLEYLGSQSDELQKVSLTLMQNRDCNPHFKHIIQYTEKLKQGILDSQVCAAAIEGGRLVGGKDTCQGDSGGPLQITLKDPCVFYVVGLTSFAAAGCGEENSPGVYTRVSEYIDWIESKVWS
jgi:V8-like Glu-specific endopeptidase